MTNTFFFDVSDIRTYVRTESTVSGIQRVSLSVIDRMVDRFGPERVKIAFWSGKGRYECLDGDVIAGRTDIFDTEYLSHLFYGDRALTREQIAPTLERYRTRPLKYRLHLCYRHLQALIGNERYFAKKGSSLAAWRAFHRQPQAKRPSRGFSPHRKPRLVEEIAHAGDRIIIMGAIWGQKGLAATLERFATERDVYTTTLVHDLIPILGPEFMHSGYSHSFDQWLKDSVRYSESYIANSRNTAKDLTEYLEQQGTLRSVKVIPLAQYFERPAPSGKRKLREEVRELLEHPFVLVVGTMESRKNLLRLAQAWELLEKRELQMPRLVLAGKENWRKPDFREWIADTNALNGLIRIIIRPSDEELTALYEACLFTAQVSTFEGWGLPVGESLSMGKTAVVANTTSLPEVGDDMVEYCDPYDIDSIAAAVERLIQDPDHRSMLEHRISETDLRTWDDVVDDFVALLTENDRTGPPDPQHDLDRD